MKKQWITYPQMSVQTSISSGASQIFPCSVTNMLPRFWIAISFDETKVDDIYKISTVTQTHQEVIRFDITMNIIATMYKFDTTYLLKYKQTENK